MAAFMEQYGAVEKCQVALEEARWAGFHCPECDGALLRAVAERPNVSALKLMHHQGGELPGARGRGSKKQDSLCAGSADFC